MIPITCSAQDMEIVRGAGDDAQPVDVTAESLARLRQGVLRVRQRPGPKNALGLIKFVFPNEEDVYMHGTPAQALFARSRRDFSHGCVRVEDPVALAEWVLRGSAGVDARPHSRSDGGSADRSRDTPASDSGAPVLHDRCGHARGRHAPLRRGHLPPRCAGWIAHWRRARCATDQPCAVSCRLPGAHAAGVDVDEIRGGVVADAAALCGDGGLSQRGERHVREPDVDGLTRMCRLPAATPSLRCRSISLVRRRPIAGDDLKRPRRFRHAGQRMQQIEQARIDLVDVARAEVAQEVIHGGQRIWQICAAAEVFDCEPLAGVRMSEAERANAR